MFKKEGRNGSERAVEYTRSFDWLRTRKSTRASTRHSSAVPVPVWQTLPSVNETGQATLNGSGASLASHCIAIGKICNGVVGQDDKSRVRQFVTPNGYMFRWKKQPDLTHIENGKTIKEVWKDVPPSMCPAASLRSASSMPQVSNLGRLRRQDGSITMGIERSNGYRSVHFKGCNHQYIHRLVCTAFNSEPSKALPVCDHIDSHHYTDDDHPFPNRASNLRWVAFGC